MARRSLKILIFMPFAISFVGAGIIWKFMYDYRQGDQIGLLNAIVMAFGGQPVPWLAVEPLVNTLLLVVVFIWSQTGLAMVILSAAIKARADRSRWRPPSSTARTPGSGSAT